VIEATASYEWLWQLLEPLAQRLVLAHPKKLRIIAESTRQSDKLDAKVLAEFLALGMIPEALPADAAAAATPPAGAAAFLSAEADRRLEEQDPPPGGQPQR
jgi:hypothetical protein